MRVTGDQLYIGTFDSSVIFMDELLGGDLLTIHGKLKKVIENNLNLLGADVYVEKKKKKSDRLSEPFRFGKKSSDF
jgi:hypothetical protein